MKKLLLVFTSLLVISGIVSAVLWGDLRTERQANAALRLELAKSGSVSRAAAAPAIPAEPAQDVAAPQPAVISEAPVAEATPTSPLLESEVFMSAMSAAILGRATAAAGISDRELLKDPEYREAQLTQARLRLALSHPGLVETLGLSRTEADHLFDAMAETQVKLTVEFTGMGGNAAGTPPSTTAMRDMVAGREDPVRPVLGEARYAQYREYLRNAKPVLSRVSSLGYSLNSASQPLNDSQARALAAAVLAERQRQEAAAASRPNSDPASWNAADALAERRQAEEESRRRVIAAVSPHLDSAQIDVLQKEHEQQIAFARQGDAGLQATPQPARGNQP